MIPKPGPHTQKARRRKKDKEYEAAKEKAWLERCDEWGSVTCECGEVRIHSIKEASFHHIIHRSQGGSNDPNNLKITARWGCGCHAKYHGRNEIYY